MVFQYNSMLMGFVSEKYIESYTVKTEFFSEAVEAIIAPNQVDDSLVFESESNSIGQVEIIRMEPVTLESNKTRVCANTKNPRQGSLFLSGIIQKYAKYSYYVSSECPLNEPRVKMIPYVKCCMTVESVYDKIQYSSTRYDIIVVSGDEYCAIKSKIVHFRQYYGGSAIGVNSEKNTPLWFPLGPRREFKRVDQARDIIPAVARKYLINFVGSPTSVSRRYLATLFGMAHWKPIVEASFVHITNGWKQKVSEAAGYITPDEYRQVLLNSVFTLSPIGHNPEAYRIYEACEAGSIPILTLGEPNYLKHKCSDAYTPFIKAKAPFVFLNTWDELPKFLEKANSTFIKERQNQIRSWYEKFMTNNIEIFESTMMKNFRSRIE